MLRTTINMHIVVYFKISFVAARLGKSRRDVIVMLLMRIMRDIHKFQGGFTLMQYQERDPLKQWHCFSISYKMDENEFFRDLGRLSKFTVSHLVAIATERYLMELMNEINERHKYVPFSHATMGQSTESGIICWEFYWGDPGDTPKNRTKAEIHRRTATF